MNRNGQMNDAMRILLGGTISIITILSLYVTVSFTASVGTSSDQNCHPKWASKMSTRALLQTKNTGEPLRTKIGRTVVEDGVTDAHNVIYSVLSANSSLNWFWSINNQRSHGPGYDENGIGRDEATEALDNTNPITYTYDDEDIRIQTVTVNKDNPC